MPYERDFYHETTGTDWETVFSVPSNMIGKLTRIEIRNPLSSDVRVRVADVYTPEGGSETTETKLDYTVVAEDTISNDLKGSKAVIGTVKVKSSVAGVQVSISVRFE